jgi:hypothetical protein
MKINQLSAFLLTATLLFNACGKKTVVEPIDTNTIIIAEGGTLTGSYDKPVLVQGKNIILKGYTYFASGSTLTIPAGTTIKSDVTDKGAIIIERAFKIFLSNLSKPHWSISNIFKALSAVSVSIFPLLLTIA